MHVALAQLCSTGTEMTHAHFCQKGSKLSTEVIILGWRCSISDAGWECPGTHATHAQGRGADRKHACGSVCMTPVALLKCRMAALFTSSHHPSASPPTVASSPFPALIHPGISSSRRLMARNTSSCKSAAAATGSKRKPNCSRLALQRITEFDTPMSTNAPVGRK